MHDLDSGRAAQEALMRALARTADARRSQGRYTDAARLYRRALDLAERLFVPHHPEPTAIRKLLGSLGEPRDRS